ncbi:MAG TPA: hypothetical protein VMF07_21985 [Solirubrobacteraceae bacterium]|nr:hypothetical protein [Solirubrobacteraceae bacterium]
MGTFNGSGGEEERRDELDAAEAIDIRPARRQRLRRPWVPLGLLVLLFILVAVVPRHGLHSRTFPSGSWGATLRCLERNTNFRVVAFGTSVAPERATTMVAVQTNLAHHTLAELRQAPSAAAARAVARHNGFGEIDRSGYQTDGRVVWAYNQSGGASNFTVNAGERALIDACVRHPG